MRIAMLGPFGLSPKGTMRARALPLARALATCGHQVTVIMPPWHTPHAAPRTWQDQDVDLQYVALTPRVPGLSHLAIAWRMVRAALAWRPDVIHCFKPKAYAGLAAWALWHMHRLGIWRGTLVMDEDDWEGAGGWNEIEDYAAVLRHFFAWQERWGLRHAHAVTVASRTCESLVWALGVPPQQTFYLPNGADLDIPVPCQKGLALRRALDLQGHPLVLLYTRFFEFDVSRPLKVMARVVQALPEARLLVVGQGLFASEDRRFDELAQEMGLGNHIVRTGWVEPQELPAYFGASDVGLHLLDDTLVNRCKCSAKLIEQLAAGVPMVADNVGQNASYIIHGENGLLTPPGDIEAMAAEVIQLLNDREKRAGLTRGAQERVRQRFGWSTLIEDLLTAYHQTAR